MDMYVGGKRKRLKQTKSLTSTVFTDLTLERREKNFKGL